MLKQSITVKKESTTTGSGNWDCNIVMWPFPTLSDITTTGVAEMTPVLGTTNGALSSGGSTYTKYSIGGLTVNQAAGGTPTYGTLAGAFSGTTSSIYIADDYLKGSWRIVGGGFEIVNETADIYRQGSLAIYSQPVAAPGACRFNALLGNAGGTVLGSADVCAINQPPATLAEAVLLEGTQIWKAAEGCYVPMTQSTIDNPAGCCRPQINGYYIGDPAQHASVTRIMGSNGATATLGSASRFCPPQQQMSPFNLSGAYLTGLSDQTSLTVTATWYIQRFPTPIEKDLVLLCRPSPAYDPMALQIYLEALNSMPVGCKQNENPLGEWFANVVHKVANLTAPALKMASVIHPAFGLAGNIASGLAAATNPQFSEQERRQAVNKQRKKANNRVRRMNGQAPKPKRSKKLKALPPNAGPGSLVS